jgi:hypothetical protein
MKNLENVNKYLVNSHNFVSNFFGTYNFNFVKWYHSIM